MLKNTKYSVLSLLIFLSCAVVPTSFTLASRAQLQNLEIQIGNSQITVQEPEPSDSIRNNFENLSSKEQDSFYINRKNFLTQAAKALRVLKYGFGIGSLVKEKLTFQVRKIQDDLQFEELMQLPETAQKEALFVREQGMVQKAIQQDAAIRKTLAQRSDEVLAHFLMALDRKLWQQALLFSRSNEFGLMGSIGLQGIGAMASKGGVGGFFEIGISIGYNRETKSLAFQIFRNIENFQQAHVKFILVAGVSAKAGFYIANQKTGELSYKGQSFYPPVVPGYSSFTERNFSTGPFTGLTIPPSPISDVFSYTNRLDQKVMLRVTISPLLKSFVKMEFGLGLDTIKFIVAPVLDATRMIYNLVMGVKSCGSALL